MSDGDGTPTRSTIGALLGGSLALGSPALLAVAAAVVLLFLPRAGSEQRAPLQPTEAGLASDEVQDGKPQATTTEWNRKANALASLKPLWEHLGIDGDEEAAYGCSIACRINIPKVRDRLPADRSTLIATFPDPKDTGSAFEFDMGLEAIQRAIESEGFALVGFSNPWRAQAQGGQGTRDEWPGPTDHRRQPGCLVYRSGDERAPDDKASAMIVLLVVGESPTSGVHTRALETSLDIAEALTEPDSATQRKTLKLLGPTFSGTAASVAGVLSRWLSEEQGERKKSNVWVCSGSATSVDKKVFEKDSTPAAAAPGASQRVIYAATVLQDELVLDELLRYLGNPSGGDPERPIGKTVMLVEAGSLYGNRFFRHIEEINQRKEIECLFIPFPRRLGELRDVPPASDPLNLTASPSPAGSVPLQEKAGPSDYFPPFDPKMTGSTDRLILSQILETISSEQARYVGIVASEARNVLYLANLVNTYCPDVRVFLINNDVLFAHENFASDFYGAIVASSYPLDSRSQTWSFPNKGDKMRRLLANEVDLGRYNACLVLINGIEDPERRGRVVLRGNGEDMLVYGPPFEESSREGLPRLSRPCVWISIIGRNRAWPLRAVSLETMFRRSEARHREGLKEFRGRVLAKLRSDRSAIQDASPTSTTVLRARLKATAELAETLQATLKRPDGDPGQS